jgi:D-alanyl-D-alanine carboxypeptidase
MASMLETHFKARGLETSGAIAAAAGDPPGFVRKASAKLASAPVPRDKPQIAVERFAQAVAEGAPSSEGDEDAAEAAGAAIAQPTSASTTVASLILQEALAETAGIPETAPAELGNAKSDLLPVNPEPEQGAASEIAAVQPASSWIIQVGAFPTREGAESRLGTANDAGVALLTGKTGFVISLEKANRILYRARFSGFTEETAREACKALNRKGVGCLALAPRG